MNRETRIGDKAQFCALRKKLPFLIFAENILIERSLNEAGFEPLFTDDATKDCEPLELKEVTTRRFHLKESAGLG